MAQNEIPSDIDLSLSTMGWLVDRFSKSWVERVGELKEGVDSSKNNEDDYIYHELRNEIKKILVENEKPDEATFKVHGVRIRKKVVHRKSERYNGADLYLEVEGVKFALVQFKVGMTRFTFDAEELKNLEKFCEICVQNPNRPIACPVFVCLIRQYGANRYGQELSPKHRILKVCQLRRILGSRLSANVQEFDHEGITRDNFKELLATCWEGAPFVLKPSDQKLLDYAEKLNRLLIDYNVSLP